MLVTVSDLLNAIRDHYVVLLARAASEHPYFVEPAFRNREGALVMEGALSLPCRADLIAKDGGAVGALTRVDSTSQLNFEPLLFKLGNTEVQVSPFTWDWLPLEVHGLNKAVASSALRSWFLQWFDTDDENPATKDGLQGVAHFMSDLSLDGSGWRLTIDAGSASASAVEELMFCLSDAGAARVRLGSATLV
jgi:hypothetical protein